MCVERRSTLSSRRPRSSSSPSGTTASWPRPRRARFHGAVPGGDRGPRRGRTMTWILVRVSVPPVLPDRVRAAHLLFGKRQLDHQRHVAVARCAAGARAGWPSSDMQIRLSSIDSTLA